MVKRRDGMAEDGGLRKYRGRKALDREDFHCDECRHSPGSVHWHTGTVQEFLGLTDEEVEIINKRLEALNLQPLSARS